MAFNKYRNPFILGFWAPAYLLVGAGAIVNDFLMGAMFIMGTLALLGAYVTEFPIFSGLYQNELLHKVAVSSLLGILFGLILFALRMVFVGNDGGGDGSPISPGGKFFIVWSIMSGPAYIMMIFLVRKLNTRDLEEENRIRMEKKKKRSGPPIMKRDGF